MKINTGEKGGGFLVAGDFDGDGKVDLVNTNINASSLYVHLSKHPAHFATSSCCKNGSMAGPRERWRHERRWKTGHGGDGGGSNSISIHLGNGDGTFAPRQTLGNLKGPYATVLADFNGDGKLDIAVVEKLGENITVFLNDGMGKFEDRREFHVGKGCCAIVAKDLDGDGAIDIAVVNRENSTLSVLRGKGEGSFYPVKHFATGKGPVDILVSDLNQDGMKD